MVDRLRPDADRTKDVMNPAGCVLSNYEQNPIVLASHDPTQPIGTARAAIRNDRVEALIDFAPAGITAPRRTNIAASPRQASCAPSGRLDPIEYKPNSQAATTTTEWELMEKSRLVAVPANPGARIIARGLPRTPSRSRQGHVRPRVLASILDDLGYLQSMTAFEAEMEGDGSNLPAMLGEAMRSSPTR